MKISLQTANTVIAKADSDLPVFAQLVGIGDMGDVETSFQGQTKTVHKIKFFFVGYQKTEAGILDIKPISLSHEVNFFLNEKAALYKMLKAWKGSVATEVDFGALIGTNAKLKIEDRVVGDKTYQNIISFAPHDLLKENTVTWPRHPWMVALAKGSYGLFGNFSEYKEKAADEPVVDIDVSDVCVGLDDEPKVDTTKVSEKHKEVLTKPAVAPAKVVEVDEIDALAEFGV